MRNHESSPFPNSNQSPPQKKQPLHSAKTTLQTKAIWNPKPGSETTTGNYGNKLAYTQHSSYLPSSSQIPTHYPLAIPLRPRTYPLDIHHTLTTNHQRRQIRMSDVGRPPMGRHQRHLRRKSERRVRLIRFEWFLGRRSRSGGDRQRRRRGHAEHLHRWPRTRERAGNGGVSLSGEFKSRSYRRWVCSFLLSFPCL